MLSNLYIENIAVIEKTNIEFSPGLNVLTGETGAGKSIVIDSINAILGKRSSKGLVRSGTDKAFVSATFEELGPLVIKKLTSMGYETEDGVLILQRELSASGKNTCRINSRPCTVSALKEIGEYLVNIHGQNDNLELMNPALHIVYIDALADIASELSSFRQTFRMWKEAREELDSQDSDEQQRLSRIDLLRFQIEELENTSVTVGEYDVLTAEKNALLNREKIAKELMKAQIALDGDGDGEQGALRLLDDASSALIAASRYLEQMEGIADRLSSAFYELQEVSSDLRSSVDDIDASPERLEEIEERLDLLYRMKKKYGSTEEEMLSYLDDAKKELGFLTDYAYNREQLEKRCAALFAQANEKAQRLSDIRKKVCESFITSVEKEMAFLEMPNIRLEITQERTELNTRGFDRIEFLISANPGEDPKPVSKIASGGELSRMMLAIKTVLSKADFVDTLIFDEIDTGISGSAAGRVGKKLKELSHDRQVMCVTHQAQIAAFADAHLLIQKSVENGRTYTHVTSLEDDGRVEELARIVGGEEITGTARDHAKELLRYSREGP